MGYEKDGAYLAQFYFIECRGEQDVRKTYIINQDFLYIEVGDGGRNEQCIVMGEMKVSQVFIGEGDGLVSYRQWH